MAIPRFGGRLLRCFFAGNFSAAEVNGQQLSTDIERDFGTGNLLLEEIQQIENDKELAKQLQEQEQERVTKFEAKRKIHSHKKTQKYTHQSKRQV